MADAAKSRFTGENYSHPFTSTYMAVMGCMASTVWLSYLRYRSVRSTNEAQHDPVASNQRLESAQILCDGTHLSYHLILKAPSYALPRPTRTKRATFITTSTSQISTAKIVTTQPFLMLRPVASASPAAPSPSLGAAITVII